MIIFRFDLFDEDDFNETEETNTSNEIFNLRLIHSNYHLSRLCIVNFQFVKFNYYYYY